jgi:hypothetical protein
MKGEDRADDDPSHDEEGGDAEKKRRRVQRACDVSKIRRGKLHYTIADGARVVLPDIRSAGKRRYDAMDCSLKKGRAAIGERRRDPSASMQL